MSSEGWRRFKEPSSPQDTSFLPHRLLSSPVWPCMSSVFYLICPENGGGFRLLETEEGRDSGGAAWVLLVARARWLQLLRVTGFAWEDQGWYWARSPAEGARP